MHGALWCLSNYRKRCGEPPGSWGYKEVQPEHSMNLIAVRRPTLSDKPLPTTLGELRHFMHPPTLLFFQASVLIRLGSFHSAFENVPN